MNRPRPFFPLRALAHDERGLTTVEYVIVLCLIAVIAVATWQKFGAKVQDRLANAASVIGGELDKPPPAKE